MRIYSADIETDNLDATKIWCMSITELNTTEEIRSWDVVDYDEMKSLLQEDVIWIFHNGLCFDKPTLERLLGVEFRGEVIDTLVLSWYLFPLNRRHGLETWGEYFGVPKPEIEDWEGLNIAEYIHRCSEDVKIQTKLWKVCHMAMVKLYHSQEKAWRAIRHLNFKMEVIALQEKSGWKLDVEGTEKLGELLQNKFINAKKALEEEMPPVPVYVSKSKPKKMFKKNGEVSKLGEKWLVLLSEKGLSSGYSKDIQVLKEYKDPNAGSHDQIKRFLYSLGWEPQTFKFIRDKEGDKEPRKIPQIRTMEGELCESIIKLIKDNPQLEHLGDMSVVRHRISICSGFLNSVNDEGFVKASAQGLTNTLRLKHRTCVNIPSIRKPYGKEIRSLLTARGDEWELCGSDQSSLEDRTKQHFLWDYDPDYVKEMMSDDFDPHTTISLEAGLMTDSEVSEYKSEGITKERKNELAAKRYKGKTTNYAATYGAGADTIARAADIPIKEAEMLHKAYWDKNWSVKAVADNCVVKEVTIRGIKLKWLWNPVAELWIHLKAEKDRFSTLNQSTATYCFDRWVYHILEYRKQMTATFHDEVVLEVPKGNRSVIEELIISANDKVNKELNLNRELGCDIDFGDTYAEIH